MLIGAFLAMLKALNAHAEAMQIEFMTDLTLLIMRSSVVVVMALDLLVVFEPLFVLFVVNVL